LSNSPSCVVLRLNLQHVQEQYNQSKKVYLQEQMKAHMDPVKLGLKREVRGSQLGARGGGGAWDWQGLAWDLGGPREAGAQAEGEGGPLGMGHGTRWV